MRAKIKYSCIMFIYTCLFALAVAAADVSETVQVNDKDKVREQERERDRRKATDKALAWMMSQQNEDGSFGDKFKLVNTSLALMSSLAAGVTYTDATRGEALRKSLNYVLSIQNTSGYFGHSDESKMYGHGITALMLAESLGMIGDDELEENARSALEKALALTVKAARVKKSDVNAGGWRYLPDSNDSDMSLSGWQLLSLHAAQQIGIDVPQDVIDAAYKYVRSKISDKGGVGYNSVNSPSSNLRGLGMLCLYLVGKGADDLIDKIGNNILADRIQWSGERFFYRAYYDAVGMSRAKPEMWEQYSAHFQKVLVSHQDKDGSWSSPPSNREADYGKVFVTSMAILALTVEDGLLPAYQR
ncbi:MAG: terpene cyclase/mutase family protein [Planctomycetes bacterium]|nr:terpene cyclase/mutase family protein [Planctomycetota bacterium]